MGTVNEYLTWWLSSIEPTITPTTHSHYRLQIKHLTAFIGSMDLEVLNRGEIRNCYRALLDSGLGCRTVADIHGVLRRSLRDAVKSGILSSNPADGIDARRLEERTIPVFKPSPQWDLMNEFYNLRGNDSIVKAISSGELNALVERARQAGYEVGLTLTSRRTD